MKRILIGLLIAVMLLSISASAERSYQHISVKEAKRILSEEEDYVFVDARPEEYYEDSHIPGAINVPTATIKTGDITELPELDQKIIVYCYTGYRSREAAAALGHLGYTQVFEFGGLIMWTGATVGLEEEEEYDDDPFEAKEYANPDDFYYEFEEEFDDYEEAEEYYYEHGGW